MKAGRMITALLLIAVLTVRGCGLFPEQGPYVPEELFLYRPASGGTHGPVPDDVNSFPAPVVYNSNHYDRFWMNSWNSTRDYTQLTVK